MKEIIVIAAILFSSGLLRAAGEPKQIRLTTGNSFVIDTACDITRVAVATDDTVDAVAITQREIVLNARAPGETTVLLWQKGAPRLAYDVIVEPSMAKLDELRQKMLEEVGDSVQVDLENKSVVVRGLVKTQAMGRRAMALASTLGTPVNLLQVQAAAPVTPPQILLKVRFADVDRTASLSLGANFFSTGAGNTTGSVTTQQFTAPSPSATTGSTPFTLSNALNIFLYRPDLNLGATIEALAAKNLAQILAEPNVLAIDGQEASFLAGGEFPYPVIQSTTAGVNNVTIQFRQFGIRLDFTPIITPQGTIRLQVEPEVSALDYTNGLSYGGFNIPGLTVRRVKTEVELQNNQSFAIAGLLDNTLTEQLSKVPGLGDIPLFGKLFQSRTTTRANSELLVVVTPQLVLPNGTTPAPSLQMPKPFLDVPPAPIINDFNPADPRRLPSAPAVPFSPASAVTQAASQTLPQDKNSANPFKPEPMK